MKKNIGGLLPANGEVSISTSGMTGAFCKSDTDTLWTVSGKFQGELPPQYSIDAPAPQGYATIPDGCQAWLTPRQQHTEDRPWCREMQCLCHFQAWRMERYFIGPIERDDLSIAEAIDLYHAEPGYMARKMDAAMEREAVLV